MIKIGRDIPLIGCIAFGIIDRGTNLLQVRATSACNLNCIFCSTDSGKLSKCHNDNFEVDLNYLIEEIQKMVEYKECNDVEINIDSVGEPLMYKATVELVRQCKEIDGVSRVSMQTNGMLLNEEKIKELKKAGLDCINLSINAMDDRLSKKLSGVENYKIADMIENAREIVEIGIELRLCPVWIPGMNDEEIEKIVIFSKEIGAKMGIQKYEVYKYSRKVPKIKNINWWRFYDNLKKLEKKHNIKLILTRNDLGIHKAKRIEEVFKKGERVKLQVKLPGWYKGQMIGVGRNRCVSLIDCRAKINDLVNVKILETDNNLYIGEVI